MIPHMASQRESIEHLRAVPLLSGATAAELRAVLGLGERITASAGQVVLEQGQVGREAFLVLTGTLRVRRNTRTLARIGPGAMVGTLALLDHGPRTATVCCDTECTLVVFAQRQFLTLLDATPTLAHRVMANLAGQLRALDGHYIG
jgi:CRP-like cAMP-binding protein